LLSNPSDTVRARQQAPEALDRVRRWQLRALQQLPAHEREARERALRVDWYLEDYRRDHDRQLREAAHTRAIEQIRAHAAQQRRTREAMSISSTEAAMRTYRSPLLLGKGKTPIDVAWRFHRQRAEATGDEIPDLRNELLEWANEINADMRWTAIPGTNAYAFTYSHAIETQPIRSEASFAVGMHEVAHIANPCEPTHVRVANGDGGTCCVRCEITAWTAAIDRIQRTRAWTFEMHIEMASALRTYRHHGTAEEQAEIELITSRLGFYRARLQRVMREA